MPKKIKVGIIFGGRSAEHEVSVKSAKNVMAAIDKKKYEVVLIGIDKNGRWFMIDNAKFLSGRNTILNMPDQKAKGSALATQNKNINPATFALNRSIDVIFPILHGPYGEDGTIQGLLKLANIPFVGAGVLGSAVGMDKDAMKRLLREAGIPVAKFLVYKSDEKINLNKIAKILGLPFFVKPANLGSSVGISKVRNKKEFIKAIELAFQYDVKIIIEENIKGREIECAILGNNKPIASVPGEVIPRIDFYSYEAKYLDENGAVLEIPAKLSKSIVRKIQNLAVKTFKVLCCEGMGRVDFFLKSNGEILVNEINTIPGFTSISMYPKLWEASGISYPDLIDRLIRLAHERFKKEQKIKSAD